MFHLIIKKLVRLRNYLIYKKYAIWARITNKPIPTDPEAKFVVSIASYPQRAYLLPAVFESIKSQTVHPRKTILVLTEEEWPERKIPRYLIKLEKQGLEILWVSENPYSVKMMLPVIQAYPNLGVITLGDDWIYKRKFIECTIDSTPAKENKIAGPLGKVLYRKGEELHMFFREKEPANKNSSPEQTFLMGLGTYYPANSLDPDVLDLAAIKKIVPGRGSDLWFWAASIAKGNFHHCIGDFSVRKYTLPIPENNKTKPKDTPGLEEMNRRFNKAIDFFGIREKLLEVLPDISEKNAPSK